MSLKAGQLVGPYRIARQLGQGGQATAYLAEDSRLSRMVVLKVLRPDTADEAARRRFEREACLCSALDHPNIAAVYDLGESDGVPYIVMQYVEGKSLQDLLGGRPLSPSSALSLGIQIADGLSVAHAAGIVHRDMKSTNVIVTPAGQAKILDFGLAKQVGPIDAGRGEDPLTSVGTPYGTIGYSSPEQATGEPVDHRTDVFSLGVLLYEMLAGRRPFSGRNALEVLHSVVNHVPPPLSDRARVPPELEAIVERAMAKRPRDRYQTMAALRDDLKAVLRRLTHDSGGATRDPSVPLRPTEWMGRRWPTPFTRLLTWRRPRSLPLSGLLPDEDTPTAAADEDRPPAAPAPPAGKALAVMPLRNLTGDPALDVLGIAFADGLITTLAGLDGLRVRPFTSVVRYSGADVDPRRVGAEQDVSWVLTGTFLRNADRVRVSVQLLAPGTEELVWADRLDLPAQDPLAAQDALGEHVLAGVRVQLSPQEAAQTEQPMRNAEAYELFLRGREMLGHFVLRSFDVNDLELAIRLLNESAGLDPDFAGVHASLARSYLLHAQGYGGPEYFRLAERAVRRSLDLQPASMKARIQDIYVRLLDGDMERARSGLAEVQREAPERPAVLELAGHLHRLAGDHDAALSDFEHLLAVSPADASLVEYKRARVLIQASRYAEARAALERAQQVAPNHALIEALTGLLDLCQGRNDQAVRLLRDVLQRHPSFDGVRPLLVCGLRADDEDGRALLTDAVREAARADPDVAFWLGAAHTHLGNTAEAIDWLGQAVRLGQHDRQFFTASPLLHSLRHGQGIGAVLDLIPLVSLSRPGEA